MSESSATVSGMDNRVPQQRVNKLGHVVTKHVRAWESDPQAIKTIPSPLLNRSDFVLSNQRVLPSEIVSVLIQKVPAQNRAQLMNTLHPDTPAALNASSIKGNMMSQSVKACVQKLDFALLNNMAVLSSKYDDGLPDEFNQYCEGLQVSRKPGDPLDLTKTPELTDYAFAVVRAAHSLNYTGYVSGNRNGEVRSVDVDSPYLRELLRTRPMDVDRITDLLNERGLSMGSMSDAQDLEALLDASPSGVLGEGAL